MGEGERTSRRSATQRGQKDPYFDWGQALLQISIVLASVAIVAGGNFLLGVSGVLGVFGTLLTVNGFLLIFKLPFLG